jgi:hypothetical protein
MKRGRGRLPIGDRPMTTAERQRKYRAKLKPPTPEGDKAQRLTDRIAELQAELADMRRQRDDVIEKSTYGPAKLLDPDNWNDWVAMVTCRLEIGTDDERHLFMSKLVLRFFDFEAIVETGFERFGEETMVGIFDRILDRRSADSDAD